jgi:hypothetical protein
MSAGAPAPGQEGLAALHARLARVEDELAIRRVVLAYGPAADSGSTTLAASAWLEDGDYDWDAAAEPHRGRTGVRAMLRSDGHQGLVSGGIAHFAGPPLIELDGDRATALTYSLIMRRDAEGDRFYLWRVSAARWDLERAGTTWRVRRRTNRLLDETGAGRELMVAVTQEMFGGEIS